jgi:L-threonylcarbamoyladenylate synthase
LAVDPWNPAALERLLAVKGRDAAKGLLLIAANRAQVQHVAEIPLEADRYIQAFWPGPLTLVLPKRQDLPGLASGGRLTVGVRIPGCKAARQLCLAFGGAITSTSANRSGAPAARCVEEVNLEGVACAIDAGPLDPDVLPSTLLDPVGGEILREGAIPESSLAACQ